MNKEKLTRKAFLSWLIFIGFAFFLPVLICVLGFSYVKSVVISERLRNYQLEASGILERMRLSSDSGLYLCNRINDVFMSCSDPLELERKMHNLSDELDGAIDFFIWNSNGTIATATFDISAYDVDWPLAFKSLSMARKNRHPRQDEEVINLRKIFGPQFFPEMHPNCYSGRNIKPMYGDSSMRIRPSWMRTIKRFGMGVFIDHELLGGLAGIKFQIDSASQNSDFKLVALIAGKIEADSAVSDAVSVAELEDIGSSFDSPQRRGNWYVFKSMIKKDTYGYCFLPVEKVETLEIGALWRLVFFILALTGVLSCLKSFRVIVGGEHLSISIRRQLVILFLVANSLSMIILVLTGFDYLRQYRFFLYTQAFDRGITYLQSIDEMISSEYARQLRIMNKSVASLKNDLQKQLPAGGVMRNFMSAQDSEPFRIFLIGSHSPVIYSELGIMKDGKFIEEINMDYARYQSMQLLVDSMGKLGEFYLSMLNKETMSELKVAQIEVIAESLGQLKPLEMFQEFFAATGGFWQWGMGSRSYPAYINVLDVFGGGNSDFVLLYLWHDFMLHRNYLVRCFHDFNRNPLGLKVMAVDEDFRYSLPTDMLDHKQLKMFSSRLREKSGTEFEFCNWEDEKYLLFGLKCNSINTVRLLGLSPADRIDREINKKLLAFSVFGLISFLVSLSLGLFVSRSILAPLSELQQGIVALKNRDFAYRLPDLGTDEFGNLAKIFNTTLVDLEELHVASTVEGKIIETIGDVRQAGSYRVFGDSFSVQKLGGDYFDFWQSSDTGFNICIGDVAGNGVSVSLLLAFVRACVLQLRSEKNDSAQFLARLDDLIRSMSAQNNRRAMTFVYCELDGATGNVDMANAGHCFPMLINSADKKIRVLEMPSRPLGTGRRQNINSLRHVLGKDETMILYSGGLYRNCDMGFDRICSIIEESYCSCPKEYVQRIMERLTVYAPVDLRTDDISLMIISPDELC